MLQGKRGANFQVETSPLSFMTRASPRVLSAMGGLDATAPTINDTINVINSKLPFKLFNTPTPQPGDAPTLAEANNRVAAAAPGAAAAAQAQPAAAGGAAAAAGAKTPAAAAAAATTTGMSTGAKLALVGAGVILLGGLGFAVWPSSGGSSKRKRAVSGLGWMDRRRSRFWA